MRDASNISISSDSDANIDKMTFEKFTPIQKTVIPLITDGYDIMGCSKTGSGKTAAFGIPIINLMLLRGPPKTSKIPSKIFNKLFQLRTLINLALRRYKKYLGACTRTSCLNAK